MYKEILPENGLKNIETLDNNELLYNFYLAGGTGLALQLGHRKSIDFYFFSIQSFNTNNHINMLQNCGEFKLLNEAKGTVTGIFNGIKISFFHYNYPLLWDLKRFRNIKVASPKEIGLMKFTAIAGRGTKKDFIDLYWIGTTICALTELFSCFDKKYGSTYNLYHILKSLIYFEDADKDKNPKMLEPVDWIEIKEFFIKEEEKIFNKFYKK